jgi:hypothetical protein
MVSGDSLRHTHHPGPLDVGVRSDRLSVFWAINSKCGTRRTHFLPATGTQAHIPHLGILQECLNHVGSLCKQGGLIEQPKGL